LLWIFRFSFGKNIEIWNGIRSFIRIYLFQSLCVSSTWTKLNKKWLSGIKWQKKIKNNFPKDYNSSCRDKFHSKSMIWRMFSNLRFILEIYNAFLFFTNLKRCIMLLFSNSCQIAKIMNNMNFSSKMQRNQNYSKIFDQFIVLLFLIIFSAWSNTFSQKEKWKKKCFFFRKWERKNLVKKSRRYKRCRYKRCRYKGYWL
jgi:hypothetical protein